MFMILRNNFFKSPFSNVKIQFKNKILKLKLKLKLK